MSSRDINIDIIRDKLQQVLPDKRFIHSVGTEIKARELANKFGVDENKAAVAGLLHDCARCIKKEKMFDYMNERDIPFEADSINSPSTLHAYVSEYLARTEYDINDPEILSAIRNHTLGDIRMTDLDKIVFIADKIEDKTRVGAPFDEIRRALDKTSNLNEAILVSYAQTIIGLVNKKYYINEITLRNWNYLLEETGKIKPIIEDIGLYRKVLEANNNNNQKH